MIVRISGGIGNQMFQYAIKKKLDILNNDVNYIDTRFFDYKKVHNGYELDKVFGIHDIEYKGSIQAPSETHRLLHKIFYKLGKRMFITRKYAMEILIDYCESYGSFSGPKFYLDGYWQSEEYFSSISGEIKRLFTFPNFDESKNLELLQILKKENAVALHVRRGDFLNSSKFVCLGSTDYYQKAIEYIRKTVNAPLFVILSDDIDWCKKNLEIYENKVYVDWNNGDKSFRDMQIMTECKHCVIANSSFSWWGAWLNKNPESIIIAPNKFYYGNARNEEHLLPSGWVKIDYNKR